MANLWFNIRFYKWHFQWGPDDGPIVTTNDHWQGKYWPPIGIYQLFGRSVFLG